MSDRLYTFAEVQEEFKRFQFLMPDWEISVEPLLSGDPSTGFLVMITVNTFNTYTFREPEPSPDFPTRFVSPAWGEGTISARRFAREHQNPRVQIRHVRNLPLPIPRRAFPDMLRNCIHAALQHEADEWIQVDGDMAYDPHRTDRR